MSDCTGYGFDVDVKICTNGPLTDTQTTDLSISFSNAFRSNFNSSAIINVPAWDGREIEVDISSALGSEGFNQVGCNLVTASLKLTPFGDPERVTVTLTFVLDQCPPGGPQPITGTNTCVGVGPHIITDVNTVRLNDGVCPA